MYRVKACYDVWWQQQLAWAHLVSDELFAHPIAETHHDFYGDEFKIECPTGSGHEMTLIEVSGELERRLVSLFETNEGRRPSNGDDPLFHDHPDWQDSISFMNTSMRIGPRARRQPSNGLDSTRCFHS